MSVFVSIYTVLLFVALTPGVLLTLPKGGKKLVVAAVHGLVFALVYHFTNKLVLEMSLSSEGFRRKSGPTAEYMAELDEMAILDNPASVAVTAGGAAAMRAAAAANFRAHTDAVAAAAAARRARTTARAAARGQAAL